MRERIVSFDVAFGVATSAIVCLMHLSINVVSPRASLAAFGRSIEIGGAYSLADEEAFFI